MIQNPFVRLTAFLLFCVCLSANAVDEPHFPGLPFVKDSLPIDVGRTHYPRQALSNDISGSVTVALAISNIGTVTESRIVSSIPEGVFDQVVLNAIRNWKYPPHLIDGQPVAFQTLFRFVFEAKIPSFSPSGRPRFVWNSEDLRAEILSGPPRATRNQNRYLQLTTQKFKSTQSGWSQYNISIPNEWSIKALSVENGFVRLVTTREDSYRVDATNVDGIWDLIVKYHPITNEQLLSVWRELALEKN